MRPGDTKKLERPSDCPHCGRTMSAVTTLIQGEPSPGDVTICLDCLAILKFDQELQLTAVTNEEVEMFPDGVVISLMRAQHMIRQMKERHRSGKIPDFYQAKRQGAPSLELRRAFMAAEKNWETMSPQDKKMVMDMINDYINGK